MRPFDLRAWTNVHEWSAQMTDIETCYLCGSPLMRETEAVDDDHVPPKQVCPKDFRKTHNTNNLLTLTVHHTCNKAYQNDEDYFVNSVGILAQGSQTGDRLRKDLVRQYERPDGKRLVR